MAQDGTSQRPVPAGAERPPWRGRRVAVLGLGVENVPLIRYLVREGARVVAGDRKRAEDLGSAASELSALPVELCLGEDYLSALDGAEALFLTPGMPKRLPEIEAARARGVEVSSQMELFMELCKARVIGVTGSSGKTTTTTLIGKVLEEAGERVLVGGNIGRPLIEEAEQIPPDAWVVLEFSSFQLETIKKSPHISLVTNVTPNHLDVHESMGAYIDAKRRILDFQGPSDHAVLNMDHPVTERMAKEAKGHLWKFSRKHQVARGAHVVDDHVMWVPGGGEPPQPVCRVDEIRLLGVHNLENVLAATAVGGVCSVGIPAIRNVVTTFEGVPNRLEPVAETAGIRFFNDSIATTPVRAAAGIRSFDAPVVLIAGGYDKKLSFEPLARATVDGARGVALLGATASQIEDSIRSEAASRGTEPPRLERVESLEEAVEWCGAFAKSGDVVLLSPGCASYDMFPNFEARGRLFRRLVSEWVARCEQRLSDASFQAEFAASSDADDAPE